MGFGEVFLLYVCPTLGGFMSTAMFAAPIHDMRTSLSNGKLGNLSPFPFAMMTGNTVGWLIYGYYVTDPFILAANLPGFILSIWLNIGTAKLQYLEIRHKQSTSISERNQILQRWDADRVPEEEEEGSRGIMGDDDPRRRKQRQRQRQRQRQQRNAAEREEERDGLIQDSYLLEESHQIMTPQETLLLRVLVFWSCILIWTSWLYPNNHDPANLVGIVVNINLVAFYASPLKTIRTVISERDSASIHRETMIMNWINTSFWIAYGCARGDHVIVIPNFIGLILGIIQGFLMILYPRQQSSSLLLDNNNNAARLSLHELEADLRRIENPEEIVPTGDTTIQLSSPPRVDAPEVI